MDVTVILTGILLCLAVLCVLAVYRTLGLLRVPELPTVERVPVQLPHDLEEAEPKPTVRDGIATIHNPHFGLQQAMQYAVKQADAGHSSTLVHGVEVGPMVVSYKKDDGDASIHARPVTRLEKAMGGDITVDTTHHPEPLVSGHDVYAVRQCKQKLPQVDIAVEPGETMLSPEMEAKVLAWEKYSAQLDVDAAKAVYADEEGVPREPRVSPGFCEFPVEMPKSAEA